MTADPEWHVHLERLFELSLDLLCVATLEGYFAHLNPAFLDVLGHTEEVLLSRPFLDFVHPDDLDATIAELGGLRDNRLTTCFENRYRCADGSFRWLEWKAVPVPDDGVIYAAARDITAQKEAERRRDELSLTVSHELRTPMTAIRGSIGLLAGGAAGSLPAEARQMLDIASANAERLIRLLNDLLDIEKLESADPALEVRRTAVGDLFAQATQTVEAIATEAGVGLRVGVQDAVLLGDASRLVQVLTNLLANAIRLSPKQTEVWLTYERGPGDTHRLVVKDRGPGVPDGDKTSIFERFHQSTSARKSRDTSGLGLAIARAIVTQHGGRIWVEDRPDGGSQFVVEIP